MKKTALPGSILLIFLLLILSACSCRQASTTSLSTTGSDSTTSTTTLSSTSTLQTVTITSTGSTPTATGKEFIWEISSDTTTLYLLGSVHVASESTYPLDSVIEKAFDSVDNLVVEVDITNTDTTNEMTAFIIKNGTYPKGDSLKNHLSDSIYTGLSELFEKFGISMTLINVYRPWVIAVMLEQLIAEDLGYKAELGIDNYFLDKAIDTGKNILELETAEFQLELLSSFPDGLMIRALQEDVEYVPSREDFEEMFRIWEEGDTDKMESLVFEPLDQNPELSLYYEKMFDERNINMANQIFDFLNDDENYFVVVGAGHLVGEKGLLNLLKEKNYSVTQLEDLD